MNNPTASNQAQSNTQSSSGDGNASAKRSTRANGELITWYLARLRNNSRQSTLDRKLTPLTLVETDRTLIQEIVMASHGGYEQKCKETLTALRKINKGIHNSQAILVAVGVLGCLFLFSLVFF